MSSNVPTDRPVLLIGNHQINGYDSLLLVKQFLNENNKLIRSLTHPYVSQVNLNN